MRLEVGCNGKQLLLLVIVSIAAAIFVSSDNPPSQYNIEGFVFDADGSAAATGTNISLFNVNRSQNTSTFTLNAGGRYSVIIDGSGSEIIVITAFNETHIGKKTISLPQPDGGITVVEGVNISLNDHPTLGVPALNDTSPTANADIRATVSYSDQENDAGSVQFIWLLNGTIVFSETFSIVANGDVLSVLLSSNFNRGDRIKARVNSTDGFYPQGPQESDEGVVENSAPRGTTLRFSPASPDTGDDLSGLYDFQDDDGDPEGGSEIKWFKNGIEQQALENSSTVDSGNLAINDRWSFTVRPTDGDNFGSLASSLNVTINNQPPNVSVPLFNDTDVRTEEDVSASAVFSDNDGNEGNILFQWFIDDVNIENDTVECCANGTNLTSAIAGALFNKNDQIKVKALANDGSSSSEEKTSETVVVGNTPPLSSNLDIAPAGPNTTAALTLSYTFFDIDGDPELNSHIRWLKNGIEQAALGNQTSVPGSLTSKGDIWSFGLKVGDGESLDTERFSLNATINNSLPRAQSVSISPSSPKTDDNLVGRFTFSDPDGDSSKSDFRWFKNDVEQSSLRNLTAVGRSLTKKSERWRFEVKPGDGDGYGRPANSSQVTIKNTVPVASSPKISPTKPKDKNDLKATYSYKDADGDKEKGSRIYWYKNGKRQSKLTDKKTVDDKLTKVGEKWHFSIAPKDGTSFGTAKTSPKVTILK